MRRQDDRHTGTSSDALADNILQRKLTENVRRRNEIWREAEQLFQMAYVASLAFLDRSCLRRIDLSWAIEFIESARLSHRFQHAYIPFWSPTPDDLRRWDAVLGACRAVDDALGRYPDTRYDFLGLHQAIAREPIWHRVADAVVVAVARSARTIDASINTFASDDALKAVIDLLIKERGFHEHFRPNLNAVSVNLVGIYR